MVYVSTINARVGYRSQSEDNPNFRQTLISLSQMLQGIQTKLLDIGIRIFNSFKLNVIDFGQDYQKPCTRHSALQDIRKIAISDTLNAELHVIGKHLIQTINLYDFIFHNQLQINRARSIKVIMENHTSQVKIKKASLGYTY